MPGSSPEADLIEGDISTEQPDASASATSSTADQNGDKAPSLIDSVKEAISKDTGTSPSPEQDPNDPGATQKPETTEQPEAAKPNPDALGDLTEDELKRYGPKTQARMRQLLGQRKEANEQAEKLKAELEPKAKKFDEIDTYIRNNNLSNEDVGVIFEIGALIRNDPFKALERVQPIYEKLLEITGDVLPAELQERVNLGYISKEDAKVQNRANRQNQFLVNRQTEDQRRAAETEQTRARTQHVNMCRESAEKWEATKVGADPDWKLKQPRIQELLKLSVLEKGYPESQAAVVQLLDSIYGRVSEELKQIRPQRPEIKPVTNTASTRGTADPNSLLDAVKTGLGRG